MNARSKERKTKKGGRERQKGGRLAVQVIEDSHCVPLSTSVLFSHSVTGACEWDTYNKQDI